MMIQHLLVVVVVTVIHTVTVLVAKMMVDPLQENPHFYDVEPVDCT